MDTKKFLDQDGLIDVFGVVADWIRSGSLVLLCDIYDPQGVTAPIDPVDGSGAVVSTESVIVPGVMFRKAEGIFVMVNFELNDSEIVCKHYKSWKDYGVYGPKDESGCVVPVAGKCYLCTGNRKIYQWTGTEMSVFAEIVPEATSGTKGIASFGDGLNVSGGNVTLKKATSSVLGGVKIGDGLSVDSTGKVAMDAGDGLIIDSGTKKAKVGLSNGGGLKITSNGKIALDECTQQEIETAVALGRYFAGFDEELQLPESADASALSLDDMPEEYQAMLADAGVEAASADEGPEAAGESDNASETSEERSAE